MELVGIVPSGVVFPTSNNLDYVFQVNANTALP